MKKKTDFYFILVDAKLRRIWVDSKKYRQFFSNLCGQSVDKRPNNGQIKEIGRKVVQKCAQRSVRNIVSEDVRKLIKIWMINKRFVSLHQNWSLL